MSKIAVLTFIATLSACSLQPSKIVGDFVKGYCASIPDSARIAARLRVAAASHPHQIYIDCHEDTQ